MRKSAHANAMMILSLRDLIYNFSTRRSKIIDRSTDKFFSVYEFLSNNTDVFYIVHKGREELCNSSSRISNEHFSACPRRSRSLRFCICRFHREPVVSSRRERFIGTRARSRDSAFAYDEKEEKSVDREKKTSMSYTRSEPRHLRSIHDIST